MTMCRGDAAADVAADVARVDDVGNRALVHAARAARVRHSVRASGVPVTILRAWAFVEAHAERIGQSVMDRG